VSRPRAQARPGEGSPWSPPKCAFWRKARLGFGARNQGTDFESAEQVETGSSLVNQAGEALADILEQAQRAASFVEEIASAAAEQANGLKEINTGVNQLDHATQQNRAVSEETTASAADLLAQSDELIAALSEFRIEGGERSTAKRGGGHPAPIPALKARSSP
jgi:methyl-accepting chemotaxis protein